MTNQRGVGNPNEKTLNLNIALFFSHGTSIETWKHLGFLDREVSYYQRLNHRIGDVVFVTYDTNMTSMKSQSIWRTSIDILHNHWRLPYRIFGLIAPILHSHRLRNIHIFKSNQLSGAWTALIAKWLHQKPLIVRCGFISSRNWKRSGVSRFRIQLLSILERISLLSANMVFVSNESDRNYLLKAYNLSHKKIKIIPNSIDCDRFKPSNISTKQPGLIIFVGRLSEEKNVDLLIEACSTISACQLLIIGKGPLGQKLRSDASTERVKFLGVVPNRKLPRLLNESEIFVLPSRYEGNPKALLEAMSCGLAVIGTNVPGINNVIEHGVNGLLCESDADSLSKAIHKLIGDRVLRKRLGENARQFIVDNFSMERIIQCEIGLLKSIMETQK